MSIICLIYQISVEISILSLPNLKIALKNNLQCVAAFVSLCICRKIFVYFIRARKSD